MGVKIDHYWKDNRPGWKNYLLHEKTQATSNVEYGLISEKYSNVLQPRFLKKIG